MKTEQCERGLSHMHLHENGDTETKCGLKYQNFFWTDSCWKAQNVKEIKFSHKSFKSFVYISYSSIFFTSSTPLLNSTFIDSSLAWSYKVKKFKHWLPIRKKQKLVDWASFTLQQIKFEDLRTIFQAWEEVSRSYTRILKAVCPDINKLQARTVETTDMMLTSMLLFENLIGYELTA